jgi:8-oxo-dGTP pyrophosphatase MutT (NUDIX family)
MIGTQDTLLGTGNWSDNLHWELYQTTQLPPAELCTAVMCVAIADGKIVLARSTRGWGMLGGHIEDGETLEDALRREALEEGGFTIGHTRLFAVRKITAQKPAPHQQAGKSYPFPTSYIAYYWATTDTPLHVVTGSEILESRSVTLAEVHTLDTPDEPVIVAGWNAHQSELLRA